MSNVIKNTERLINAIVADARRAAPLCGAEGTRNRICAADRGHVGAHNFFPRAVRED